MYEAIATRYLSEQDQLLLRALIDRYAAAYLLHGPEKQRLVGDVLDVLATETRLLDVYPIEKVVAETTQMVARDLARK
jgi:hypothetical protein